MRALRRIFESTFFSGSTQCSLKKKENRDLARLDPSITDQLRVDHRVFPYIQKVALGEIPTSMHEMSTRPPVNSLSDGRGTRGIGEYPQPSVYY